ncbi:MAG: excinuclease ABC subunit B [Pseudomonadota bacterium]
MKLTWLLICIPLPALAWEFSPLPLCTLSHDTEDAQLVITHDPRVPEYRLDLALTGAPWAASPSFGMTFQGGAALTIGTSRHMIDGSNLQVRDQGFGNVLNGLEYNSTATAFTEQQTVTFSLDGAAEPVRAFKSCTEDTQVVS